MADQGGLGAEEFIALAGIPPATHRGCGGRLALDISRGIYWCQACREEVEDFD